MMKMSKMNICCAILAIVAIIFAILYFRQRERCPSGSLILRNKEGVISAKGLNDEWNKLALFAEGKNPVAETFRYNRRGFSEEMRYLRANFQNFKDFRTQFKNAILAAVKAPSLAQKKALFAEVKKVFNLYLDDTPALKTVYNFVMGLIIKELVPLVQKELNKVIFNADGSIKGYAATLCKMGQSGSGLFSELYHKYVSGPLGSALDVILAQPVIADIIKIVKMLGLNIKSVLMSAIQSVAQDKIGEVIIKAQGYLEASLSKATGRTISCQPKDMTQFVPPADVIIAEEDASSFDDL